MVSGSDSAPPRPGSVADGSRREDASPLSLPGPFTESDSELWHSNHTRMFLSTLRVKVLVGKSEQRSSHLQPYMRSDEDIRLINTV